MGFSIIPYTDEWTSAVKNFNQRLQAGGAGESLFPEASSSRDFPQTPERNLFQNYFLLTDGPHVRAGYILKYQQFCNWGEALTLADYQLPLSEGIVDKRFNLLGVQLLVD